MNTQPENIGQFTSGLLEHLTNAVLLFDCQLKLRYINPAGEMMFAVSSKHIQGSPVDGLLPCPGAQIESKLRKSLETGNAFTEREIKIVTQDDREITVNCSAQPLQRCDAPDQLLIELHQVDRHLRISREEHLLSLQKASQALVRGLAHEIKNPLGGLRGAAQLLEQELPDPGLKEYTRIIIEEADRLQSLMNRMLGPSRLVEHTLINIHNVLERVRQLVLAEEGDKIALRRDYDPSLPAVEGDFDLLIQAFLNIVRNGAKAAGPEGNILLRTRVLRQFTISNTRHRMVMLVEIEDDGPGIPQELQERIFLPMVTGMEGGTGLGLTIAQNLIHQHHGLIECRSKKGKTIFSVFLPLETRND